MHFYSHDGRGVEVSVRVGTTRVTGIRPAGVGRTTSNPDFIRIEFEEDNPNLQFPVSATTKKGSAIHRRAEEAMKAGDSVSWRIESQRKALADPKLPHKALKADDLIVMVAQIGDVRSPEAVTDPEDDPVTQHVDAVAAKRASALKAGALPLGQSSGAAGGITADGALKAVRYLRASGASAGEQATAIALAFSLGVTQAALDEVETDEATGGPREVRRSVAREGKQWDSHNSDGRVNLGSYAVTAASSMVEAARKALARETPEISFADPAVERLAGALLVIADQVQAQVTGARPNRMAASHGRARGIVHTLLEGHLPPPSTQATSEQKKVWVTQMVAEGTAALGLARKLTEACFGDEPSSPAPSITPAPTPLASASNDASPFGPHDAPPFAAAQTAVAPAPVAPATATRASAAPAGNPTVRAKFERLIRNVGVKHEDVVAYLCSRSLDPNSERDQSAVLGEFAGAAGLRRLRDAVEALVAV